MQKINHPNKLFTLGVCLFGLKMLSGKSFPEFLVFGSKRGWKIIYPGKSFHAIGWKMTSTTTLLKLISNSFTTHQSHQLYPGNTA